MVKVFKELTPENIIKKISPNTLVKGGDYKIKDIIGANFVRSNKGNVKLVSLKKGYSTTEILNRQTLPLRQDYKQKVQDYFKEND